MDTKTVTTISIGTALGLTIFAVGAILVWAVASGVSRSQRQAESRAALHKETEALMVRACGEARELYEKALANRDALHDAHLAADLCEGRAGVYAVIDRDRGSACQEMLGAYETAATTVPPEELATARRKAAICLGSS